MTQAPTFYWRQGVAPWPYRQGPAATLLRVADTECAFLYFPARLIGMQVRRSTQIGEA